MPPGEQASENLRAGPPVAVAANELKAPAVGGDELAPLHTPVAEEMPGILQGALHKRAGRSPVLVAIGGDNLPNNVEHGVAPIHEEEHALQTR